MTIGQNFQWVGEGIILNPSLKRGKRIFYKAFTVGDLNIKIGDFVLVRNDDALDPEDLMSCYVAEVKNLFDTGGDCDPYQAQVQWFSRVLELPSYAIKLFKNVGHDLEIVKDKRSSWNDIIDAETIFKKCEVLFLSSDCDFDSVISEYKNDAEFATPIFFCRYTFTGTSLIEVKEQVEDKTRKVSLTKGDSTVNGTTPKKNKLLNKSHELNYDVSIESPSKIPRLLNESHQQYCAISVGSPSKIPRVLIKKIDDKILESRTRNVRVFVADPSVKNIEDVADIFLNKLKLEKKEENSLEKKPIIHTFTSKSDNSECETCFGSSNETSSTSETVSNEKYSINFNTKFCKNIFSYNTRNSPKKNASAKGESPCTTPPKKLRFTMINEVSLKSSSRKVRAFVDEDNVKFRSGKNNHCDNDRNKIKKENKFEKRDLSIDTDMEIDPLSFRTKINFRSKETANHANNSIKKEITNVRIRTPRKCSNLNSDLNSTPKKEEILDINENSPNKYTKVENCNSYSTPKKKVKLSKIENSDPNSTLKKVEVPDVNKNSPNKYNKMENDTFSTPKKKNKFIDGFQEFHLTRSGRRVKAVNYTEEKNETTLISAITPTKKLPRYVCSNYSDDSDSDHFSPSSQSSDEDDCSLNEGSPDKTKCSFKKKISKKSGSTLNERTPKSRKNLINLHIPERKTPLRTPKNALEESRQRLHVSSVPNSLPCRDEEYSDIYSFVKGCLCAQTGGCMYISGVPGTGKTATVHEVIRNLEEEKELGEVPIFTFVEVNGMWMTDPYQCYVQIFKALNGKSIAPQQAADLLEKRFTDRGPKKDAVVLLVDELDRLWTRKQTVMYNIFDWPTKINSKLIVLAIANTMDLPERMMMNRISSRLGLTRKTFQPYTFKQLQEIIMSRIQELKVFDPDAVQLVARKVAAVSGDARRALDICRFATETIKVGQTVKKGQKILVGMEQVDKALQQMFSSPVISAIKSSSKIVKIFFQCILSEFTRTGLEETTLLKVYRQVISTCRFEGLNPPNSTDIMRICADLTASHLILVDNFKNDICMKIRLNISSDDVAYALTLK